MSKTAWKCYRCDLIFREESHAVLHKDLANHFARKIELIVA